METENLAEEIALTLMRTYQRARADVQEKRGVFAPDEVEGRVATRAAVKDVLKTKFGIQINNDALPIIHAGVFWTYRVSRRLTVPTLFANRFRYVKWHGRAAQALAKLYPTLKLHECPGLERAPNGWRHDALRDWSWDNTDVPENHKAKFLNDLLQWLIQFAAFQGDTSFSPAAEKLLRRKLLEYFLEHIGTDPAETWPRPMPWAVDSAGP